MLMGYRESDLIKMMSAVKACLLALPENNPTRKYLQDTYDFLDGMIVEGRI